MVRTGLPETDSVSARMEGMKLTAKERQSLINYLLGFTPRGVALGLDMIERDRGRIRKLRKENARAGR